MMATCSRKMIAYLQLGFQVGYVSVRKIEIFNATRGRNRTHVADVGSLALATVAHARRG